MRSYKPERGNEHSIVGKDVRRICGDGKGHLYIQTIEGICIFDMYSETFETIQKGPGHSITYSSDTLLIGGNGSVYYYDVLNHQVKPYCSLEGDIQVSSLLKDKTGRLWLGTRGDGLYCLRKGEMKQLCVLPQCNVFNLYQDSSGDIWVCTWEDGLYHISDNGTVHYTDGGADRTHCISSNSVRDCCEDNQGNLWIATFNGLDKFDKKKNEFVYYTSTDIPGSL